MGGGAAARDLMHKGVVALNGAGKERPCQRLHREKRNGFDQLPTFNPPLPPYGKYRDG